MRRINPCWRGWACNGGMNPSSGDQDQAQVQALYSSDMPVSEPVWWGIPCKFSFWVFQLWIGGILTAGYRIVELWLVWLIFCEEALTLSDIPMCDFFWEGIPCKFLFCTFHDGIGRGFRWHEASSSWWAQVQALSKWYTRVWTQKRGYPLQIFILHVSILNWGDEDAVGLLDFWNDMWIAFANPADVYFLHLSCRDILNKTSILSVVGGSAGVSLS